MNSYLKDSIEKVTGDCCELFHEISMPGETKLGIRSETNLSWIAAIGRQSIIGLPILCGCCPKPDYG